MSRFTFLTLFVLSFFCLPLQAQERLKPYEDYIRKYTPLAMTQQVVYGIPASITLAQGLLESGAGNSTLAKNSNNHFGIKCHNDWKGKTYSHFDDGEMSCFRKYSKVEESYKDHSIFLSERERYAFFV
jgi:flagellum-specific peptidoglycan hydrolase FlgJ